MWSSSFLIREDFPYHIRYIMEIASKNIPLLGIMDT